MLLILIVIYLVVSYECYLYYIGLFVLVKKLFQQIEKEWKGLQNA